jgi:acetyl esterase/lipase
MKKSKKVWVIVMAIILALVIIIVAAVGIMTRKMAVGGLLKSDSIDFVSDSDNKVNASNPVLKMMQIMWKGCSFSDAATHEKQTQPDGIERIYDIPYIDDGNVYHLLDVYYPQDATEKLPVIIDIHGGGWMYGNKNLNENYCLALASRGYIVFNMSYRLAPDVNVCEQLGDVANALKWINDNISNYPADESNIILTGDSAGGQLAVYSAVLLQSEELRDIFGVVDGELELSGLILTSPVAYMNNHDLFSVYMTLLWGADRENQPIYNYMNLDEIIDYAQLPPTYLITSSGDMLANKQTHKAYDLLQSKGVECKIADYGKLDGKKQPHVFSVLEPYDNAGTTAIDEALSFFEVETANN